jgi:hypothetical protein
LFHSSFFTVQRNLANPFYTCASHAVTMTSSYTANFGGQLKICGYNIVSKLS